MASFPEFLRFRQGLLSGAPQLPGLLNRPPQGPPPPMPPPQPRGGGIGGALGSIFGGADDPRLSPEENERARKQAMIQAGLGILASPDSGLRAIAQGGMYGQQAGMQGRQGMLEMRQATQVEAEKKARQERLRGAVKDGKIDKSALERLMVESIISGDTEASGDLSEVLKSMGGNVASMPSLQEKSGINPATGKPELYTFDPRTGKREWGGVSPIVSPTSTGSDIQQQRVFTRENSLRDDYKTEVRDTETAYKFIDNALNKRTDAKAGNPAAQVALLYGFVKAMDPNSVVREGEIALAGAAAPMWSRAQALYADVVQGKSPAIPPSMVDQMADFMEQMQTEKESHWSDIYDNYTGSAERWGVDPAAFRKPPTKYRSRTSTPAPAPGRFGNLVPGGG